MTDTRQRQRYEIGLVGLGVMGRNLLLNMADHGFGVAGTNRDQHKVEALRLEAQGRDVYGATSLEELVGVLRKPRVVMLLVTAGPPVDAVIDDLLQLLDSGDLIIDAGNSHFMDTDLRAANLAAAGISYLGVGVSGGEDGARHGPSIMAGGAADAYERVRPVFEAIAAKVDGDPCVARLGAGSAGHFVKMVHNGIEYAVMQLIAETYDLMKRGLDLGNDRLRDVYGQWNAGELSGYLMGITSRIFGEVDEKTGNRLIDEIRGVARQKGTGTWTSASAKELHVPIPTIDAAAAMRDLSVFAAEREQADAIYRRFSRLIGGDRDAFLEQLPRALLAGMIIAYAQGMALLSAASREYEFHLDLAVVARIWRGGCIIRTTLLEDLRAAFQAWPELPNLLLAPNVVSRVAEHEGCLRQVVCGAVEAGLPVPGLMASLGYLDAFRSAWSPTNLIQAQRDYFGAHTYERIDAKGAFHTDWERS